MSCPFICRAHRIGQTRSVEVVILYMKHTIEERLLAYRKYADAFVQGNEMGVMDGTSANPNDRKGKNAMSLQMIKYLFGLEDVSVEWRA